MSSESHHRSAIWDELTALVQSKTPPREFWQKFVSLAVQAVPANAAVVLFRKGEDPWRPTAAAIRAANPAAKAAAQEFINQIPQQADHPDWNAGISMAQVPTRREGEACRIAILTELTGAARQTAEEKLTALAALPLAYDANAALQKSEGDISKLTRVMDAMLLTNTENRFGGAAMALCNAVATQFACDRVSLSWHENGFCKLEAISRTEMFDRKMVLAQKLEAAMDECLDQDEEIRHPAAPDARYVSRDHAALAEETESRHILSLPVRHGGKLVGVVTCQRPDTDFTDAEMEALRLAVDSATPRLALLKKHDRWWGARLWRSIKESSATILGPKHTVAKLAAVLITLLLAILLFWKVNYRVEGTFVLRSDEAATLTSPFEGFIKEVMVESGDKVTRGQVLLRLDADPLRVEESSALAELERFRSEADKARAAKSTAEMAIAEAMARQAQAKLDVVRYQLERSEIKSPMDGIVVEGDLKERLSSPVKQGDPLFRVAKLGRQHLEFNLDERDAHLVTGNAAGEAAFVSQPDRRLPIAVDVLVPAAMERDGLHSFTGKARFQTPEEDWWRPGMSGICKLEAGRRSLFWILTHRTVEFLRMKLWW